MKYVRNVRDTKRYRFPTHINDLIFDRSESRASETFFVVLGPGEAPPRHRHPDTEQIFYIIQGRGIFSAGKKDRSFPVKRGDVVLVPAQTWHSLRAIRRPVRYLAVNCFLSQDAKLEPTWDAHVRAMCLEHGWDYRSIKRKKRKKN